MQPLARRLPTETETPHIADAKHAAKDVAALNGLLRGEISAVETYTQCINKLDDDTVKRTLASLRQSHALRSDRIHNRILLLDGKPDEHSGLWGTIATLFEGSASFFGERVALEALEEGERHGLRAYDRVTGISSPTRTFINTQLLPEQERTASALSTLVREFRGA